MSAVIDAAKRLALRQAGGIFGLAGRMGVNPNTLSHKLAGQSGHNLFATELELMTSLANDPEIAQAFALLCNHVCIPVACTDGIAPDLAERIARVSAEFGDMMKATVAAIQDGRVTKRELADFDRQFNEFLQGAVGLRQKLVGMIPQPPGLQAVKG